MRYPEDIMIEIIYRDEDIREACKRLAERINQDYEGKKLTLVCTLKGAVPFFSELIKFINIDCQMEFIKASSYIGNTTTTIGNVQISTVMNFPVEDREILIIEDIVDTGLTCKKLIEHFKNLNCRDVEICTMLNKPARRICDIDPKYVGFEIEDKFIIGFGLDYNEKYRNIPYIGVINPKYI